MASVSGGTQSLRGSRIDLYSKVLLSWPELNARDLSHVTSGLRSASSTLWVGTAGSHSGIPQEKDPSPLHGKTTLRRDWVLSVLSGSLECRVYQIAKAAQIYCSMVP